MEGTKVQALYGAQLEPVHWFWPVRYAWRVLMASWTSSEWAVQPSTQPMMETKLLC